MRGGMGSPVTGLTRGNINNHQTTNYNTFQAASGGQGDGDSSNSSSHKGSRKQRDLQPEGRNPRNPAPRGNGGDPPGRDPPGGGGPDRRSPPPNDDTDDSDGMSSIHSRGSASSRASFR